MSIYEIILPVWYSISEFDFPPNCREQSRFAQTIKTSKVDRWFGLIGNQDCHRMKGTRFISVKPHFGCNPDCFDYCSGPSRNSEEIKISQKEA